MKEAAILKLVDICEGFLLLKFCTELIPRKVVISTIKAEFSAIKTKGLTLSSRMFRKLSNTVRRWMNLRNWWQLLRVR